MWVEVPSGRHSSVHPHLATGLKGLGTDASFPSRQVYHQELNCLGRPEPEVHLRLLPGSKAGVSVDPSHLGEPPCSDLDA
jgi:hypothetical protein